jgi:hypothetical protein
MDNFWDLLFQLMKHGTNTLHVLFIFLFSVEWTTDLARTHSSSTTKRFYKQKWLHKRCGDTAFGFVIQCCCMLSQIVASGPHNIYCLFTQPWGRLFVPTLGTLTLYWLHSLLASPPIPTTSCRICIPDEIAVQYDLVAIWCTFKCHKSTLQSYHCPLPCPDCITADNIWKDACTPWPIYCC